MRLTISRTVVHMPLSPKTTPTSPQVPSILLHSFNYNIPANIAAIPNKDPLSTNPASPVHNLNMGTTLTADDVSVEAGGALVSVSVGVLVAVVAVVPVAVAVVDAPSLASHSAFLSVYVALPVHSSHL